MHNQILVLRAMIAAFSELSPNQVKRFDEATDGENDTDED
jgi:hypothetical protein